jgi:soluble lytic murein transglycosylase
VRLVRDYPEDPRSVEALKELEPLNLPRECFYGGVAYARNGHFGRAITLFRRIIRRSPDATWRGRAQYELALAYYDQEHYRTAQRAFEKAYRTYRVPRALFDLARCSVELRRDLEAARRFETFARLYPSVSGAAEALWDAGMAYERRGKFRESREVFLRLASRYPDSPFADQGVWRAGFALYKMGRYEAAARAFLRMAETTSEVHLRDQGYYWASKCSRRLGREEEADLYVRRAVGGFPSTYYSSRARAVLGRESESHTFVRKGNGNSAREAYQPSVGVQKGDLLARLGLHRLAEQEYLREERLNRTNLSALGDLLQRYERVGAMNRALRVSNLMLALELERGIRLSVSSFRRLYPTYYSGEINRTAHQLDLDPNLILAIIRQESAFDEEARSSAGARGLMQVMPATGLTLARKFRMRGFSVDDLWEPHVSIRFGARHLSDHLQYFAGQNGRRLGLALSAYNAGLAVARRWSRYLPDGDVDEFVESIPYRETRNYVKLVYRNYQVYSYLHGDGLPRGEGLLQ